MSFKVFSTKTALYSVFIYSLHPEIIEISYAINREAIYFPAMVFSIYFTGNYKLEVFCDASDIDEDYENYTIYLPTHSLTVEADYKIKREAVTSE